MASVSRLRMPLTLPGSLRSPGVQGDLAHDVELVCRLALHLRACRRAQMALVAAVAFDPLATMVAVVASDISSVHMREHMRRHLLAGVHQLAALGAWNLAARAGSGFARLGALLRLLPAQIECLQAAATPPLPIEGWVWPGDLQTPEIRATHVDRGHARIVEFKATILAGDRIVLCWCVAPADHEATEAKQGIDLLGNGAGRPGFFRDKSHSVVTFTVNVA